VAKSKEAGGYKRTIYDVTGQTTTTLTNKTTFTLTEPALIKVSLLYNNSSPEEIVITDVPTSASDNAHQVYAHMEKVSASGFINGSLRMTVPLMAGSYAVWVRSGANANNTLAVEEYYL
jgi:hypothetical protein